MAWIQPLYFAGFNFLLQYDRGSAESSPPREKLEFRDPCNSTERTEMVPVSQSLYLQPSLDRLRVAVLEQNRPGSVEGLLAHHVLKDNPRINIEWQVGCTP